MLIDAVAGTDSEAGTYYWASEFGHWLGRFIRQANKFAHYSILRLCAQMPLAMQPPIRGAVVQKQLSSLGDVGAGHDRNLRDTGQRAEHGHRADIVRRC